MKIVIIAGWSLIEPLIMILDDEWLKNEELWGMVIHGDWWLVIDRDWWMNGWRSMDEWMMIDGWWMNGWCMLKMKWIWMFLCCLWKCIIYRNCKEKWSSIIYNLYLECLLLLWMRFRLYAAKQGRVRCQLLWSASITRHIYSCMPMFDSWFLPVSSNTQK